MYFSGNLTTSTTTNCNNYLQRKFTKLYQSYFKKVPQFTRSIHKSILYIIGLQSSRSQKKVQHITLYDDRNDIEDVSDIHTNSEDILSFLFQYPISKLSTAEALQVEMLITTLNIQRPVLKASGIITVGIRLLASISGTVITYVLVALQFHAPCKVFKI